MALRRRWSKGAGDLVAVSWSDDAICEIVYHAGARLRRVTVSGGRLVRAWERKLAGTPNPNQWLRVERLFLCVCDRVVDAYSIDSGEHFWHLSRPSAIAGPLRCCSGGILVVDDDESWCLVETRTGKRMDSGRVGDPGHARLKNDPEPGGTVDGLRRVDSAERTSWVDRGNVVRITVTIDGAIELRDAEGEITVSGLL